MKDRDELKRLVDQIPADQLPAAREALEDLLQRWPKQATRDGKEFPRRTPVGGIITPH